MVIEFDGPECRGSVTGRGHFEYVRRPAARPASLRTSCSARRPTRKQLVAAARGGDERAIDGLAGMGRKLGAGLASLVNIFDPEVIVIGGGFGEALDLLLEPALEIAPPRCAASRTRSRARRRGGARRGSGHGRRRADRVRDARSGLGARSPSARRRSAISRTSRSACCASSRKPTSCSARTRGGRARSSRATASPRGSSATTSTTRRSGRPSSCRGSWRGSEWRSSPTPACPACPIRGAG